MSEAVEIVIDKRAGKERRHLAVMGTALPIRIHESDYRASVVVQDGRRLRVDEPSYESEEACIKACAKFNNEGSF